MRGLLKFSASRNLVSIELKSQLAAMDEKILVLNLRHSGMSHDSSPCCRSEGQLA